MPEYITPGCETESDIFKHIFSGAMHNKDREELETIFSNEFLEDPEAVKNMDKFIERYTPSYSNLLAAWEVNDTICIQLRRFRCFLFVCILIINRQIKYHLFEYLTVQLKMKKAYHDMI